MISFRYHIVSLIGVFLALALGIVVGTTALNGPITTDLRHQVESLKKDRAEFASRVKVLDGQVSDAQKFAEQYGPTIVKNVLQGKDVVMLGMPSASATVKDAVAKQISTAGGTVTARVQLTNAYSDPQRATEIKNLATAVHPLGLVLPDSDQAGDLGGALLAYVLLGKGQGSDLQQVMSSFVELRMVQVESSNVKPASLVVVVCSGTAAADDSAAATQVLTIDRFARAGGKVVVAGDTASATGGGLLARIRTDDSERSRVSTVDDTETSLGLVTAVLTLGAAARSDVGHYGTGPKADALFPQPSK